MSQATDQYRAAVSRYEEAERERDALKAELAAIRALEPALYQFRWLNPGCNPDADDNALQWKPVEPRNRLQTTQDAINELEAYRYGGWPCYEVRALVALPEQKK